MRVLLSNDDGILAPGLAALREAVEDLGAVTVVAPDGPQSAAGRSITLDAPVVCRRVHVDGGFWGIGVAGRPADCVKLACREILDELPDMVLSGINLGANAAINVLYSGTVAAAIEGAMLGVPSLAFSLAETERPDFAEAAAIARELLEKLLANWPPPHKLLNVNIPGLPRSRLRGIRVTHQSASAYRELYEKRVDPWGRTYFWITGELTREFEREPESDLRALADGYISITPLHYDLTAYQAIGDLRKRLAAEWSPPEADKTYRS